MTRSLPRALPLVLLPLLLGTTLYLQGLAQATAGNPGRAYSCFNQYRSLLPGTEQERMLELVSEGLRSLDLRL